MARRKKRSPREQGEQLSNVKAAGIVPESPGSVGRVADPAQNGYARQVPVWIASEGKLYWKGTVILHLATWAHAERAILDAFQKAEWEPVIADPFDRDTVGHDPTQSRRSAVYNVNRHLGRGSPIVFFSAHDGRIGWHRNENEQTRSSTSV